MEAEGPGANISRQEENQPVHFQHGYSSNVPISDYIPLTQRNVNQ